MNLIDIDADEPQNTPNTEFISYKENNLSKPKVKYSRILIGYSCYDEELAKCFLRLLQTGIGIHYKIICIDKFGLTEKIQIEVSESEVAIVLISKSFCDNPYCLYVLGAMWGKVKKCIPIFIPPVTAQDLDALIYGCEAIRINKRKSLNTLFDQIIFEIQLPSPPISQWNTLVSEFLSEFPKYYRNSSEKRMRGEVFLDTYAISISYALQNLLSRIDLSNEIQIYLLVLDIDRQKQINSLHGIETGDKVLESVTSIFSSYDKRFIEKGQCGDDTFFGIFVGKDIEALILSEEILARVSDIPKSMNHEKLWVTASIGVCQYKEGCLINSWKSRVHGALEEARQKGGNRVEIGELPIKFEEVKYSWCS
jgi:diguanylate cyclase (GGDEF)-like protein